MAMSFMALKVIPSLKLTDHGLVDVENFEAVGCLWSSGEGRVSHQYQAHYKRNRRAQSTAGLIYLLSGATSSSEPSAKS